MYLKTNILFFGFVLASVSSFSQNQYTGFPNAKYQIILPDSSFKINYDSTGFFSERYSAKITFEQVDMVDSTHSTYENLIKLLLKELSRPGNTILLDKIIDVNHRLLKIRIDFDITDMSPAEKGVSNILWMYVVNENSSPQILNAEYRVKYDETLNDLFLKSLTTFSKKPEH